MQTPLEILCKNNTLTLLPSDVLEECASFSYYQTLKHGEVLAGKGGEAKGLAIVVRGSLCAISYNERGQQFAFSMTETGGVWGLVAVLKPRRLIRESRAQGETEVLILPRNEILSLLDRRPDLWRHFAQMLCHHLGHSHQLLDAIALLSLRERLVRVLYMNMGTGVTDCPHNLPRVPLTQDDLAAMLSVTRHAVNRELKQIEQEGLVKTGYGYVEVIDSASLQRLSSTL